MSGYNGLCTTCRDKGYRLVLLKRGTKSDVSSLRSEGLRQISCSGKHPKGLSG